MQREVRYQSRNKRDILQQNVQPSHQLHYTRSQFLRALGEVLRSAEGTIKVNKKENLFCLSPS